MSRITRNLMRSNLAAFAAKWQQARREKALAQTFWLRFYECFGIRPEDVALYEHEVHKIGGGVG
ncbi:hypothetical protein B2A_00110, partial [mine drainage metagenome]